MQTDPKLSTLRAIRQALEAEGIQFTESIDGGYGVQFKPKSNTGGIINLLIIDDSDADRKLYKSWLNKQPDKKYNIIEAANAKDGFDAFVKAAPACIILDFMMYGKDGFQLLVEMKKEHAIIPPIIFITAFHSDIIKKDVLALGAYSYLDKKNLTKERLYELVTEALA